MIAQWRNRADRVLFPEVLPVRNDGWQTCERFAVRFVPISAASMLVPDEPDM
jgi:hypothetical protein